ncbi:MAG: aminotransferase class V-fold PLP-dependent enzyme [Candidatus Shikimatogenerans bostrichidophilus]|nr:MAG: aminotransferase class V-fold PLP-dependent enzyme [Candidatus Shikimatogenerans bostrichidophilus]
MFNKREIKKIRSNFPILKKKNFIYFDNSSTTQKPKCLINNINYYYSNLNSNINRSNYTLSNKTTDLIYKSRNKIKHFIHAKYAKEIIFTKGTTESINLISNSLNWSKNDEIVITLLEHHSNFLPWQLLSYKKKIKLKFIKINKLYNIDLNDLKKKINNKTKLISITHISNVFGTILPIYYIVNIIKKINNKILILLDGAQSIAHIPIDVQKLNIDFFVFSAHKIYGPTGLGILYGKKNILKKLNKYQVGGSMVKYVSLKKTTYLDLPSILEAGTPNISSIISFYYVIKFIEKIKIYNINIYENKLIEYTKKLFLNNKKIILYGKNNIYNSSILSFNVKNINNFDLGCLLNKYGICVRTGYHCAQPLFNYLKLKNGTIRISYGLYNKKEEINKFYFLLLKIIKTL